MKGIFSKFWPIFLTTLITFIFFFRLFYPETGLFTTPDFGLSDILHFNYPLRFTLASFLKNGKLPLWISLIGGGFPLFATGQTGVGNIIVFFTTLLFPPAIGFNLTYVLAYLVMGISTYFFARIWKLSKIASVFIAVIFSFCGSNITHFAHLDHLLTVAFIPLCFYTLEQSLRKKSLRWWIFFAIACNQCLLAGNANAFVYGFFAIGVYFLWRLSLLKKKVKKVERGKKVSFAIGSFLGAVILLLGLSAFQLLPSLELTLSSQRGKTSWAETAQQVFPYPPKHLLTFLNPYLLGDPHKATYERYNEDWGLFWENTGYIGVIPLVLAVIGVVWGVRKKVRQRRMVKRDKRVEGIFFWGFLAVFTLLLSLGKYTPLFYLLKLPILNLFRIPSTFLFVTDFALAILAGFGLDALIKKLPKRNLRFTIYDLRFTTLFAFLLFTFSLLDLMVFGYNYNPIGKAKDWEKPPEVVEFLQKDTTNYCIFSPLSAFYWNKIFQNRGWQDDASEYLSFKNFLAPDMNLLFDIPSVEFYSGIAPERAVYFSALLVDTFQVIDHSSQKELLIFDSTQKMLNIAGVKYIVSLGTINNPNFKLAASVLTKEDLTYNIYQNLLVLPRARVVCEYETAPIIETAGVKLLTANFDSQRKVVLEKEPPLQPKKDACNSEAIITKSEESLVELDVKMKENGILVLADSFYPGWEVTVDGEKDEILTANINQRAVMLPKGEHKVVFSFEPWSFKAGGIISLVSWLICGGVFFYLRKFKIQNLNPPAGG